MITSHPRLPRLPHEYAHILNPSPFFPFDWPRWFSFRHCLRTSFAIQVDDGGTADDAECLSSADTLADAATDVGVGSTDPLGILRSIGKYVVLPVLFTGITYL